MKKTIVFGTVLALVAMSFVAIKPAKAVVNLVNNGGFEEPIVGAPEMWDIFLTPDVPGWTIEWMPGSGGGYDPMLELHRGVNGWLPQEGNQYAELDTDWDGPGGGINGEPASVRIYQDIATQAGCTYNLSFWFSPRPGTPESDNSLWVYWEGEEKEGMSLPGDSQTNWQEHSMSVVATDTSSRLAFEDHGTANSLGTFLDNVSVELVSCPPPPCCGGDIEVENRNIAVIHNQVTVIATTGGNTANGDDGGDSEAKVFGNGTAIAGNGGAGGHGGTIVTGSAYSKAKVRNIVNANITRIRRY